MSEYVTKESSQLTAVDSMAGDVIADLPWMMNKEADQAQGEGVIVLFKASNDGQIYALLEFLTEDEHQDCSVSLRCLPDQLKHLSRLLSNVSQRADSMIELARKWNSHRRVRSRTQD